MPWIKKKNPAAGWEVLWAKPEKSGDGLHVRGINHDARAERDREFAWTIDRDNERFDWSRTDFHPGAAERLARIRARKGNPAPAVPRPHVRAAAEVRDGGYSYRAELRARGAAPHFFRFSGEWVPIAEARVPASALAKLRAALELDARHVSNPAPKGKAQGLDDAAARAEYKRTHWGQTGKGKVRTMHAPNPRAGVLVELGELTQIVYTTRKGSDKERVEYEHDFGGIKPRLCFNGTGLVIVGGSYGVNERGIVG